MKNTHFIILSTLFCCLFYIDTLKAEDKYTAGYVITNSNDTIRGYLQQYSINAYTKCNFKKNIEDKATLYLPGQILGYRFESGKFYISKDVPFEAENKALFLEYLIKGKANIYFMLNDKEHYYIEMDNKKMIELSEESQIISNKNGVDYFKQESYKGKLKYMLSDCSEIYSEIDRTTLAPKSIIKLAKDYHNKVCSSYQCTIYERNIKPVKVLVSIAGGVALNKFKIGTTYTNLSSQMLLGCKFEFMNLFFYSELASIQTGLIFQNFSNYNIYSIDPNSGGNKIHTLNSEFNVIALRIPLIYKYAFLHKKISPYFGAGILNSFVISNNKDFSLNEFWTDTKPSFPRYQVGLTGIVGTKFTLKNKHIVNFEIAYEYVQSLHIVDHEASLINRNISLTIGYTINK